MRLNCSKGRDLSISRFYNWICEAAGQAPEDVLRTQVQLASMLQQKYDLSGGMPFDSDGWAKFLKEFFLFRVIGKHSGLEKIFSALLNGQSSVCRIGGYELEELSGIGSDSCVYKTADGYCLKVVEISRKAKLEHEYGILRELQHENIVRCFDFICETDYAAILMETLTPVLGAESSYIRALEYCHSRGILHGDIRLNNFGSDNCGNGKLFDFGNASAIRTEEEMHQEREKLKNIMQSPIAQERKAESLGGVSC